MEKEHSSKENSANENKNASSSSTPIIRLCAPKDAPAKSQYFIPSTGKEIPMPRSCQPSGSTDIPHTARPVEGQGEAKKIVKKDEERLKKLGFDTSDNVDVTLDASHRNIRRNNTFDEEREKEEETEEEKGKGIRRKGRSQTTPNKLIPPPNLIERQESRLPPDFDDADFSSHSSDNCHDN